MRKFILVLMVVCVFVGLFSKHYVYANDHLSKIELDKTASDLDENLESIVTLSFPGSEINYDSDVVFVLDKSGESAANHIKEKTLHFLDDIHNQAIEKNINVKVGVILFNNHAIIEAELTPIQTGYDYIVEQINKDVTFGTNMHAGLLAGKELLDNDTTVADDRKHLVLISDGATYLFCKNNDYTKGYTRSYGDPTQQINPETGLNFSGPIEYAGDKKGGIWEFVVRDYFFNSVYPWVNTFTDPDKIAARLEEIKDRNADYSQYDYEYNVFSAKFNIGRIAMPLTADSITNIETACLYAKEVFDEIDSKYNTYVFYKDVADYDGSAYLEYLKRNSGGLSEDYADLTNAILNIVDKGSSVEDYIRKDFDFTNDINKISISLGDRVLPVNQISETSYGFGDNTDGTYDFVLNYVEEDNEKLELQINTFVSSSAPLQLKYSVKLVNVPKMEGTYYFDTNESATLHVINSENVYLGDLIFPVPKVVYEVGKVVSHYIDLKTNESIDIEDINYGRTNLQYTTIKKDISGYRFVKDSGNTAGKYTNGIIEVTYYYEKIKNDKPQEDPTIDTPEDKPTPVTPSYDIPKTGINYLRLRSFKNDQLHIQLIKR